MQGDAREQPLRPTSAYKMHSILVRFKESGLRFGGGIGDDGGFRESHRGNIAGDGGRSQYLGGLEDKK